MSDAPLMYRVLRRILPPFVTRYFHLHVEGLENIPDTGPAILASNHLAFIDSVFLPILVPRPVYFLAKADYFDSWKTRWFFEGVGCVPTFRSGGDKSRQALETGVRILRGGEVLGIYPEGTRSPDGRLYRGKTGPVRMALAAGAPVVPAAMIGTRQAQAPGEYLPHRHPVRVRYGKPLSFSRYESRQDDPFVLRSATDELMYEIMLLSGQEYVDEYASKVKSGQVSLDADVPTTAPTTREDDDTGRGRRAS